MLIITLRDNKRYCLYLKVILARLLEQRQAVKKGSYPDCDLGFPVRPGFTGSFCLDTAGDRSRSDTITGGIIPALEAYISNRQQHLPCLLDRLAGPENDRIVDYSLREFLVGKIRGIDTYRFPI